MVRVSLIDIDEVEISYDEFEFMIRFETLAKAAEDSTSDSVDDAVESAADSIETVVDQ